MRRIRKDSLITDKLKSTGTKLFEIIRCKKPMNEAREDGETPSIAPDQ